MGAASMSFPQFTQNTYTASHARPEVSLDLPVSLKRLFLLLGRSGQDDHGEVGPDQRAFRDAVLLVSAAISRLGEDLVSSPAIDSEGGIRVTWRAGKRQVKLVCPADKKSSVYIYWSSPEGNSLRNQNVTASVLAERLAWVRERASTATS